tara:strand:- start:134 stop:673 length:540 start_codon:yes stop_codon:yes gene_type:complete
MERDMFDTMTITKTIGGLCGALLIFLLGGWAASAIFNTKVGSNHDGEVAQGYRIEVAGAEAPAAEPEPEIDFSAVFAAADAVAGEALWRSCKACHSTEAGKNITGPYLAGVVGRPVDTAEGYTYSGALTLVTDVWTPENLNDFIEDPKGYAPGTKMSFRGMPEVEDRANLIAYLATLGG